jgi:hypothetical protein
LGVNTIYILLLGKYFGEWMLEYFYMYDVFAFGLYGSFISMAYFVLIALASIAPYVDKPLHVTFKMLLPMFFVSFVLAFIGFPGLLTGMVVMAVYLIAMKKQLGLNNATWIPIIISFNVLMFMFSFFDGTIRNILFLMLCAYLFIQGKITMHQIHNQYSASSA